MADSFLREFIRDMESEGGHCDAHPEVCRTTCPEQAELFAGAFKHCSSNARRDHLRWLATHDLFFLGVYILHRRHWIGDDPKQQGRTDEDKKKIANWYHARCMEVQEHPNGYLDIWAREHGKSEILSFALIIQNILRNPNITIGIFSHNRPLAKQFLRLIKVEFEINEDLKALFPEILYENPKQDSMKWSVDDGITVKRTSNIKESTIEAWGLVDGQPTSKRYDILHYDDIVAREQISEDMQAKTKQELENSYTLTASDPPVIRLIGTPQEVGDVMCQLMVDGGYKLRLHPAINSDGQPVFFSEQKLGWFKNHQSPKVFALQFLLDPKKAQEAHDIGFEASWWTVYKTRPNVRSLNRYIIIDPAGRAAESNSYYALWVIGLGADHRRYILDGVVDQLTLAQRGDTLFNMVREYDPLKVIYEQYAFQADIDYLKERMDRENFRFTIQAIGGLKSKDARIERLIPMYRSQSIIAPERLMYRNSDGQEIDIIKRFHDEEWSKWPFSPKRRDQLDALSRLGDEAEINFVFPRAYGSNEQSEHWNSDTQLGGSWLSA